MCYLTHLHLRRRNSPPGSHPWPGTQPAHERGGHLQATQRQDQVDGPRAQAREASQSQRREDVRSLLTSPSLPPSRPACLAGHLARYHLARAAFFLLHLATPRRYGAYWCSHCNSQKVAFGAEAARLIRYVECVAAIPSAPPPPRHTPMRVVLLTPQPQG